MLELLQVAYAIGHSMTIVALGLRRLADAIAWDPATPAPTYSEWDDVKRALLWPVYLWRPDRFGPLYDDRGAP